MSRPPQPSLPFPAVVVISLLIFIICLSLGRYLSFQKPLWGDEVYSQVEVIQKRSYWELFLGAQMQEGSVSPLFYIGQKAISGLTGFHYAWPSVKDSPQELRARTIMRIGPSVAMSISVALIFYFFLRFYGAAAALAALGWTLTETMVLAYWPEARPYGLWYLLTTAQVLVFLYIIREPRATPKAWQLITAIHLLMPFCVILSLPQIAVVSGLLWFWMEKDKHRYIFLTAIPFLIGLYYYTRSLHLSSRFYEPALTMINTHINREEWLVLAAFTVVHLGTAPYIKLSAGRSPTVKGIRALSPIGEAGRVLWFTLLMLLAAVLLLVQFKMCQAPDGTRVAVRYFLFLSPISIIATVVFIKELWTRLSVSLWMKANLAICIGGLLIIRFLKAFIFYVGFYINGGSAG